jgi:hypothetical protein
MKKVIVLTCLICCANFIFAQGAKWHKNQIKFSPLRTVNWFNPGLELNYQRNYGNFASQISFAYLTNITDMIKLSNRVDIHGYRFNFEEKYSFPKSYFKRHRVFISCEIGYHNLNSTRESQHFIPKNNKEGEYDNSYIDDYRINRQSIIFDVKMGMEFQVNHLLFEWGMGFGVAYNYVQQLNKKNSDYEMEYGIHDVISPLFEEEGKHIILNIPITFKIGYAF